MAGQVPSARAIQRVDSLEALDFERSYRGKQPVIVTGGARELPLFNKWDLSYLRSVAGEAPVDVSHYRSTRGDYDDIEHKPWKLGDFIERLTHQEPGDVTYLFPNPSCIFARNEARKDLHTGWASAVNPGLLRLSDDFRLPSFLRPDDFVIASLILGTRKNATDLHYDWGGEGKVIAQVRGRRRIRLVSPDAAPALRLNTMFEGSGEDSEQKAPHERNPTRGQGAMTPERYAELVPWTYSGELDEGDLVYWPAFWFHEADNLTDPSLALSIFLDEIQLQPLLLRHLLLHSCNAFAAVIHGQLEGAPMTSSDLERIALTYDGLPFADLLELFREYERFLLSSRCVGIRNLWAWNSTTVVAE
ncbi:MAG: cupin-like domain-containing protein [Kofleriaceae bacterium]